MSKFAPVSITVYDRVDHLKKTIEALRANPEAADTVLYIFSDAARPGHEDKIEKVRAYIREIEGFAEVRPHFQDTNSFQVNTSQAREIPLCDFGRMIRMEDDIVVSPNYLAFMNEGLDKFADDPRVFSICAYTPDFPNPRPDIAFLSRNFSPWGYGTWKDRDLEKWLEKRNYYSDLRENLHIRTTLNRLHPLAISMLRLVERRRDNHVDLKILAHQFISNSYSVKPGTSLVENIGLDGPAMSKNGGKIARYRTTASTARIFIPDTLNFYPDLEEKEFSSQFGKARLRLGILKAKLRIFGVMPNWLFSLLRRLKQSLLGKRSAATLRMGRGEE